ncbi:hypothetical protein LPU83_pLPU83d_1025 (plasmid) [Rhizobium favelukesii]|uniref:Uncharacterized protein n=1 Tax=Rhizobium favelukesii TaxID=348824 RepID=W6RQE7_9HYPH|nr:hypothetical protein LPU83_pLPU83d_1025 [Rhizobium favelukesii]
MDRLIGSRCILPRPVDIATETKFGDGLHVYCPRGRTHGATRRPALASTSDLADKLQRIEAIDDLLCSLLPEQVGHR